MRRWAVDWLASHDDQEAMRLLAADYRLTIGAVVLEGRDAYIRGTMGELSKFPGLGLTVHDIVVADKHAAVRFTEHGAAAHRDGVRAAWGGVALFSVRDGHIEECWAEEDYAARSAQLASGEPEPVESPHVAPWDGPEEPENERAEAAARAWLAAPSGAAVLVNGAPEVSTLPAVEPEILFSSGPAVAFHGRSRVDGFALGVAGILTINDEGDVRGHLVTDRSGLKAHRARSERGAR